MASTSLGVDVRHSSFHAPLPLPLLVPYAVHSRSRSFHLRPRSPIRCQDDASPDVAQTPSPPPAPVSTSDDRLSKAVKKTTATFAPRSSTKTKNPAVPGSTLYSVFEVQGYLSMAIGGLLSFNFVFPSSEPDIWRLMGMWSIWMFTIPSLRARDCSNKEKDALNYLFLGIPLINVLIPLVWRSFAVVWTADVLAFFAVYAWKLDWFSLGEKTDN